MTKRIKTSSAKRVDASQKEVDSFVLRINRSWQMAVTSIIATGKLLIEAKAALAHGQWGKLFTEGPARGPVPFSPSTAQRLMKIAEHPILSNPAHAQHLPPSWATLYALTGIPNIALEFALERGQIHSGLQRKDVARLHYFQMYNTPRYINHLIDISLLMDPRELMQRIFDCGELTELSILRGRDYEGVLKLFFLGDYLQEMAEQAAEMGDEGDVILANWRLLIETGAISSFRECLRVDVRRHKRRAGKLRQKAAGDRDGSASTGRPRVHHKRIRLIEQGRDKSA